MKRPVAILLVGLSLWLASLAFGAVSADLDLSGEVNATDLAIMMGAWKQVLLGGTPDARADVDNSGSVNWTDVKLFLDAYLMTAVVPPTPGRYIAFVSDRPGGSGGGDVYLFDRQANGGAGALVALPGINSTSNDYVGSITTDGRYIATYHGIAGQQNIYLYDRQANAGAGGFVSLSGDINLTGLNYCTGMSPDARYLGVYNYWPGQSNAAAALWDRQAKSGAGGFVDMPNFNTAGDITEWPSVSKDAHYIAFMHKPDGTGTSWHIAVYDRVADKLLDLPNLNSAGQDEFPSISADGRYIAFQSNRDGGAADWRVYLYDCTAQAMVTLSGMPSGFGPHLPSISADGNYIAFSVNVAGNGNQVELYDRGAGALATLDGLNTTSSEDFATTR